MRLSRQWLNEYTPVRKADDTVARAFTQLGFECERVEPVGAGLDKVVTARITGIRPHPNADKLRLATVTDGSATLEVVCGAPNIAVGQIVPLARTGVTLPNGQKIAPVNIRGVASNGMLCSGQELGLTDGQSGILQLDPAVKPGAPLPLVLDLPDTVFELNIPPNRPDCLSVIGLAREYAAKTGQSLRVAKTALKESPRAVQPVAVKVTSTRAVGHYALRYLTETTVAASPWWLQKRLIAGGIRPINSVVDVTNYVMLETGQPLHAFDADMITPAAGRTSVTVRQARRGESVFLLDGSQPKLTPDITVIADAKRIIAIAGVMGAKAAAVTSTTRRILIESASFDPRAVRAASQLLKLRTESSSRFEKGITSAGADAALNAAAGLIAELTGANIQRGIVYGVKSRSAKRTIRYQPAKLASLLGVAITPAVQAALLTRLGCRVKKTGRSIAVTVPSWRIDLSDVSDLAEEVGRQYGYEKILAAYPAASTPPPSDQSLLARAWPVKQKLAGAGFNELYSYSFYGAPLADFSAQPLAKHYQLSNPLSPDQQYLRVSLVPRLLDTLRQNQGLEGNAKYFEIGTTFQMSAGRPKEMMQVAGVVPVPKHELEESYRRVKGVLELLLGRAAELAESSSGQYRVNDGQGWLRVWSPASLKMLKIDQPVISFEIALDNLVGPNPSRSFRPYSKFPPVRRDFSPILPESVAFGQIISEIRRVNDETKSSAEPGGLIVLVEKTGATFRNDDIGRNKKNLTVRCVFQSPQRTLTAAEVDALVKKITERLITTLGAAFRGHANPK